MSVNTTVIRNAVWIAAWDGSGHRYLRDGDAIAPYSLPI